jgi:hypothetical protein
MVKIPMNLPAGPGQEAFLEHFNVQVSERWLIRAAKRAEDQTVSWKVAFNEGTIELSLRYEKSVDGALLYIEANRVGDESTVLDWELLVQHLVHESSMAALAAKMQTFFRRTYRYYIGPQLDGEY